MLERENDEQGANAVDGADRPDEKAAINDFTIVDDAV